MLVAQKAITRSEWQSAPTEVHAFDLDESAQSLSLLRRTQYKIGLLWVAGISSRDFAHYTGQSVLLMCDIEGAELELLDPLKSPALRIMDLIVERHECLRAGITAELIERFVSTHHISLVGDDGQRTLEEVPEWFMNLAHLDQLLATWEWRSGPTPWLVMTCRT